MKKTRIAIIFSLCFLFYACKKSEKENAPDLNGPTTVLINLLADESADQGMEIPGQGNAGRSGATKSRPDTGQVVQTRIIPFSKDISIFATFSPETPSNPSIVHSSQQRIADGGPAKIAATPVRQPLAANIQYQVLVYDSLGTFVDSKLYAYGTEATTGGFVLNAGERYTFVGYSANSTSSVPAIVGQSLLSTAVVSNVSSDLMYFKKELRLNFGNNRLDAVLKQQFSQITTNLLVAPTTQGNITSVNSTLIRPTRSSASIKLSDGVITYGAVNTAGAPVTYNSFGAGSRSISSIPTRLISPATAAGQFTIGSVTLNGATKGDIALSNLNIIPGVKYNLNLTFQSPCTENVNTDGAIVFNVAAGGTAPSKTINAPAADFGFVFDITRLDNSFNITVNGGNLINHATVMNREIQFETGSVNQPPNIRFADGTVWGSNGIPQIYNMTGTAANPLIRIVISATGGIKMYGSKVAGGPLFPLVLFNGYFFNTTRWNTAANNVVTIGQFVSGLTALNATGYGKKIIPCP